MRSACVIPGRATRLKRGATAGCLQREIEKPRHLRLRGSLRSDVLGRRNHTNRQTSRRPDPDAFRNGSSLKMMNIPWPPNLNPENKRTLKKNLLIPCRICLGVAIWMGMSGQLISFIPGAQAEFYQTAIFLSIPGLFLKQSRTKYFSALLIGLYLILMANGYIIGIEYREWLEETKQEDILFEMILNDHPSSMTLELK